MTRAERWLVVVLMLLMVSELVVSSVQLRATVVVEQEQRVELANQAEAKEARKAFFERMNVTDANGRKMDELLRRVPTTRP